MAGNFANQYISALVVVDKSTFYVGVRSSVYDQSPSAGGVYKSTDGGATWTRIFTRAVFDLVHAPRRTQEHARRSLAHGSVPSARVRRVCRVRRVVLRARRVTLFHNITSHHIALPCGGSAI
jgi:hypothetical protein